MALEIYIIRSNSPKITKIHQNNKVLQIEALKHSFKKQIFCQIFNVLSDSFSKFG